MSDFPVTSMIRQDEVLHPCVGCGATSQIISLNGRYYRLSNTFDPETDKHWCNDCYAKDGAEERRAEMVRQYKARNRKT